MAFASAAPAGADDLGPAEEPPTTGPIERFAVEHERHDCVWTEAAGEVQWEGFTGYADNRRVDIRGDLGSKDDCVYLPGSSTTPSVEFIAYGNGAGGRTVAVDAAVIEDPELSNPEFAFTLRNSESDTISTPTIHRVEVRSCLEEVPWTPSPEPSPDRASPDVEPRRTCGQTQVLYPIACICLPGDPPEAAASSRE